MCICMYICIYIYVYTCIYVCVYERDKIDKERYDGCVNGIGKG